MAGTVQDRDVPASGFLGGAPGPSGMAPGASRWTVSGLGRGGARLAYVRSSPPRNPATPQERSRSVRFRGSYVS